VGTLAVSHRIEVVEGPRRGDKARLSRRTGLVLGRGKQTLDLLDAQVSTRHAILEWRQDRFWVKDLGSANGTRVNGVEVGPEGMVLSNGDILGLGEGLVRFVEERSLLPQWVYWVALIVLVSTTPFMVQWIIDWRLWDKMTPTLVADNAVMGHGGEPINTGGDARILPLDRCLMREVMSNGAGMSIRRVTDFDGDGVSEVWITGPSWERVYTFDPRGEWQLLGELPLGCQNSQGSGFRDLYCGNQRYAFRHGIPFQPGPDRCARGSNKGRYELARKSGVTAWLPAPDGAIGQPTPYQFDIKGTQDLAAWLGERNIDVPIHFLVCEDMFPGMGAQVLTVDGRIERLQPGCTTTIAIGGSRTVEYRSKPYAVAFTETGRQLLIEQLGVFLGGSDLGHFQNAQQRSWWARISDQPTYHSATFIELRPSPTAAARFFQPIAQEDSRLVVQPFNRIGGLAVPGARLAATWQWTNRGTILKTPCGQYLKIDVGGWRCGPPCVRGTPFLKVSQVNGPQWSVPYQNASDLRLIGDGIEVSIDVVTGPGGFVTQAVAASVAVRDQQMCTMSPVFQGPETKPLQ
jgi:hypothetical protein